MLGWSETKLVAGTKASPGGAQSLPSNLLLTANRHTDAGTEGAPSAVCLVDPVASSLRFMNHCGWGVPCMLSDRNETKDTGAALRFYFLMLPQ